MSDPIEKTAAGATRYLFGALSSILLIVGVETMADKEGIRFGLGLLLALLGVGCGYAAFFWETAKRVFAKRPTGPALALLNIIRRKGIEAIL